jgi:hypothetical protein
MLLRGIAQVRRRFAAVIAVLVAIAAMTAAGCAVAVSAAGGSTAIVVRDDANGKMVQARPGDRIELILSSSYWDVAGSSSPRVLRQDGPATLMARPSSCPTIPGLGCTPVEITFTALADGKAVITASRSSCGEALRCAPDQTRFTVTVIVRNKG